MATYWFTFRIADIGDHGARYDRLHKAAHAMSEGGKWWVESTSFYVFDSQLNIDDVAAGVKAAIDPDHDLALVGMTDVKSARAVGAVQDSDLFGLIPFAKRA
ncbi:hypothetical protein GCM10007859_28090 [Brevundimonas denitrificans]|uniref:GYD domain-containing protein n=1 Tax=Brevundimonas denitrificans TaxID=1443434 RepID=A0ABQ6BSA4_9CAUL|nr:hypothetical protein [Brevundimonas denitrificans]GLS02778.1 hypothetical protein GCM10007859_28090 [Brevundimonas denitrificans]